MLFIARDLHFLFQEAGAEGAGDPEVRLEIVQHGFADGHMDVRRDMVILHLQSLEQPGGQDFGCQQIFLGISVHGKHHYKADKLGPTHSNGAVLHSGYPLLGNAAQAFQIILSKTGNIPQTLQVLAQLDTELFLLCILQFDDQVVSPFLSP